MQTTYNRIGKLARFNINFEFKELLTYICIRDTVKKEMFLTVTKPGINDAIFELSDVCPKAKTVDDYKFLLSLDGEQELQDGVAVKLALMIKFCDIPESEFGFVINLSDGLVETYDSVASI